MLRKPLVRVRHKSSTRARWARPRPGVEQLEVRNLPSAYTPVQVLAAYGFNQLAISQPGAGKTIAIVDAYLSPNIGTDLATFDAQYKLPAINLSVINDGATTTDPTKGWELETALDVEWAHAVAPYAKVVLVEAANDAENSAGVPTALLNAVAVASGSGANVVSMSWGLPEFKSETSYDSYFNVKGVTFVASAGDNGAPPIWPSISPYVVSVGGTTLTATSTSGVYTETVWGDGQQSASRGGGGGGVSSYEVEPAFQKESYVTSVTSTQNPHGMRTSPDVAYVADPNTGVSVYDVSNGGWLVVGGTSAGSPQIAATVALADQVGNTSLSSTQTLAALYHEQADFYDVTSGNNGYAAGTGYDLASGLGSPEANLLVPNLAVQATHAGLAATDPLRVAASSGGGGTGGGGGGHGHHGEHGYYFAISSAEDVGTAIFGGAPYSVSNTGNGSPGPAATVSTGSSQGNSATASGTSGSRAGATVHLVPAMRVGEVLDDGSDGQGNQDQVMPVPQLPPAGPGNSLPASGDFNLNGDLFNFDGVPAGDCLAVFDGVGETAELIGEPGSERTPAAMAAIFALIGFSSWRMPAAEELEEHAERRMRTAGRR